MWILQFHNRQKHTNTRLHWIKGTVWHFRNSHTHTHTHTHSNPHTPTLFITQRLLQPDSSVTLWLWNIISWADARRRGNQLLVMAAALWLLSGLSRAVCLLLQVADVFLNGQDSWDERGQGVRSGDTHRALQGVPPPPPRGPRGEQQ